MQFSVPLALALSAVGVMAAPIQERTDTCCGILNGAILSGNGNPTFDGNGSPVISGNGNGNASPSNSGNGNQAGTINGNKGNGNGNSAGNGNKAGNGNEAGNDNNPIAALGSILGIGKNQ